MDSVSASSGLSFKVSKTYQEKYNTYNHTKHTYNHTKHTRFQKKEFEPMKPSCSPTLGFQSKSTQSVANFPVLPQRNNSATGKKCNEAPKLIPSWKRNVSNDVKSHTNKTRSYARKAATPTATTNTETTNKAATNTETTHTDTMKKVSFKEPTRDSYHSCNEQDSYYSDEEEYDSSYDPDEEEYNNWMRDTEHIYENSEYSGYQDEGFEESFY